MQVTLISTYDLGHQPFGLASPAAWLRDAGANVRVIDTSLTAFNPEMVAEANIIAFFVPMHTAMRLASALIPQVRAVNDGALLAAYGLYAPVNAAYLHSLGVTAVIGGEFEAELVSLYKGLLSGESMAPFNIATVDRLQFKVPSRIDLPALNEYAGLVVGDRPSQTVGYTLASRGCKHHCRHCPIVPVYNGRFRVVAIETILADIDQQVAAGATHITFGDPDFLNGPRHASRLVAAVHESFPSLTYDVTIKVEHLIRHAALVPVLQETGCLIITSAVESIDDYVLSRFDKRHTQADVATALRLLRNVNIVFNPTFVTFHPWLDLAGVASLLNFIESNGLIENVSPIQYAIRLLLPSGSLLLDDPEILAVVGPFDPTHLAYPWQHSDPQIDALYTDFYQAVYSAKRENASRSALFERLWSILHAADNHLQRTTAATTAVTNVPHFAEDWY